MAAKGIKLKGVGELSSLVVCGLFRTVHELQVFVELASSCYDLSWLLKGVPNWSQRRRGGVKSR